VILPSHPAAEAPLELAELRSTGDGDDCHRRCTGWRELDGGFLDGDSEDVAENHWKISVFR
jgi:hypothetical protein